MDAERHRKLTEIFSTASALDRERRAQYLDEACAGDATLRAEVEALVAMDQQPDPLLSPSVVDREIRGLLADPPGRAPEFQHPDQIGPYRILGLLGEGGQGIVFRAEQPTPRRIVALKVLRAGSLASQEDLRRFGKEIQALALLRHAAIATIFDGGQTEDGQHYFAMELVDGVSINAYVKNNALSLRERLELFCKICDGVHYAHCKGVIHRDLKPTNILVDTRGRPKIVDYGLVRFAGTDISSVYASSGTGLIVGSLRYMSPEQALAKSDGIKEQTDLYSLGVILYELLADQQPYELGSSLHEAVNTICEVVPPLPSAVNSELRGDLDTIVSTALEKEPSRRYGSVANLADDLRHFLHDEPITARPVSMARVLWRRIRRYRLGVALIAAALVVGTIWLGLRVWSVRTSVAHARERVVEMQYLVELGKAEQVLGQAHSLFKENPSLPSAGLVVAQAQFRAGVEHGPTSYIRAGMQNDRHAWAFRLLLAQINRGTNPETARQLEEQALLEFPETADGWYLRSFTTFDLPEALRFAKTSIARDPRHTLARTRVAYLCERVGDFDCVNEAASGAPLVHRSERHRFFWARFRAFVLMKQQMFREAVERYDSLLAVYPARNRLHADRALAYLCLREYEQAVADYAVVIDSGRSLSTWSRRWRATPLWILGRLEDAAEDYESFRELESVVSHVDARLFLIRHDRARFLEHHGRTNDAARLIEKARIDLRGARQAVGKGTWLRRVLDCLAGEESPEELIAAAVHSDLERSCEAFYYAAETALLAGRTEDARIWFGDAVATGLVFDAHELADPMSEFHLAYWRLGQLGDSLSLPGVE